MKELTAQEKQDAINAKAGFLPPAIQLGNRYQKVAEAEVITNVFVRRYEYNSSNGTGYGEHIERYISDTEFWLYRTHTGPDKFRDNNTGVWLACDKGSL